MLNMQQHPSAIASLRNQLAAGHIANLTDFWREAESLNVPLVTPVVNRPGFPGECFICEPKLPDHRF